MIEHITGDKDILKPDGFRIAKTDLLLSSLSINILSLALPAMPLQIYDRILPNQGSGTLAVLVSGVCVAVILEMLLRLGRAYSMGWAGAAYEHRLSCKAMDHILKSDLSVPMEYAIGEKLNRLASIGKLKDFYDGYSLITIFDLLFVPAFIVLTIYISGPLAIVPVATLMIFTAVSFMHGRRIRQALVARDKVDDRRYDFLIESLEGVHSIKSFGLENIFTRRYEAYEEQSTLANYDVTMRSARTFDTAAVFSNIMIAGVIGLGAVFALEGMISTGALIATILLSGRIMMPVQKALALWTKYQDYVLARHKVESLFDAPLHPVLHEPALPEEREGRLEIKNLSFKRKENEPWVLKDMNLSLARGEFVSIASNDSAALSSLLDLISGIYAPTEGEALVDGVNILAYPPTELINHVGYIQSEGVIFRGTIRDNLTCFGQIPADKVQEMAALFQIDRDIAALPSGFDTYLNGNAMDTITPGLKQRISMVRVLAPKPRLIIYDNADRSLDRAGYNLVYNLLGRLSGKATMIVCSDDRNITSQASRHFFLNKGALQELGPHSVNEHNRKYKGHVA